MERQITHFRKAILFADAVGYARIVHDYEQAALAHMRGCFQLFEKHAPLFAGELVKTTGDGAMVEFDSAIDAIEYAAYLHPELEKLNNELPIERQLHFRMGVHFGDVLSEAGDRYGNIVNIAARLEGLASAGGVCISEAVHEQVKDKLVLDYVPLGERLLNNIPEPMVVFDIPVAPLDQTQQERYANKARYEISTIDEVSVACPPSVPAIPDDQRSQALLGYLALNRKNTASKGMISRLICSELSMTDAQAVAENTISALHDFFKTVHPDLLAENPGNIALSPDLINVDLSLITAAIDNGEIDERMTEAAALPQRILAGLDQIDPAFASWLNVTRNTWQLRFVTLLEQVLAKFRFDPAVSKLAARALMVIDPTHEQACQRLISLHAREGNTPAAMRVYTEFADRISNEFNLLPSQETRQLIERLKRGELLSANKSNESKSAPFSSGFQLPLIEISPFQGLDDVGNVQYLITGFQSELKSAISKFRELVLFEAESGERNDDPDYQLKVFCDTSTEEIRMNVTLVAYKSNKYIWSERYHITLESWVETQHDIIRKIAASLNIYLSAERVSKGGQTSGLQLEPFDKWLRGEDLLNQWDPSLANDAESLFLEVNEEAPEFAPAYCSLASSLNIRHLVFPGTVRDPDRVQRALALAKRAVEIDPLETRAQLTLAWSLTMAANYDQAELHYELARELNPNSPRTLISCAQGFAFTGQLQRSKEMEAEALSLNPSIPRFLWAYLASARYIRGDYQKSVEAADLAGNAILDMPGWRAISFAALKNQTKCKEAGQELLKLAKSNWVGDPIEADQQISHWFLSSFPLRSEATLQKMKEGLRYAGIPV